MRGCLITIVLLGAVALAASWFLLPPLVGTFAEGALVAAGMKADTTTVTVSADPPPKLLTLKADSIRLQAANLTYQAIRATTADLTLEDVNLADRTFGTLRGTLKGVRLASAGGPDVAVPLVELSGTPDRIRATLTIPAADAEALAAGAVESRLGITPDQAVFATPDRVRIVAGSLTIDGRIAIRDDGALVLIPPAGTSGGSIELLVPTAAARFRLVSFQIVDRGLELVATVDVS